MAAISKYTDRRNSINGGGGIKTAEKWYPKRLNTTELDDLSAYVERVTHPVATFVVADPGSVVISGVDVTTLYPPGRMCDIRDPAHTGNNDTFHGSTVRIVATSVFAAGDTTINFSAGSDLYKYAPIFADVAGDSIISSGMFKCLVSGDYLFNASGEGYGLAETTLRIANITGFSYATDSGEVTVEGGTVSASDMYSRHDTVSGSAIMANYVVSLVADEYYELQQRSDDAVAALTGWGRGRVSLDAPTSFAYLSIERYVL